MANIWLDEQASNTARVNNAAIKSKVLLSAKNPSVKRQAFGNINNVIHNQLGVTPFRGNSAKLDNIQGKFDVSKSLCKEVLRKQQLQHNFIDAQIKLEKKLKGLEISEKKTESTPCEEKDLFDSWDYNRCCCVNAKNDAEIWSDINGNDLYEKIIQTKAKFSDFNDEDQTSYTKTVDVMNEVELKCMQNDLILPDEQLAFEYDELEFSLSLPEIDKYFDVDFSDMI